MKSSKFCYMKKKKILGIKWHGRRWGRIIEKSSPLRAKTGFVIKNGDKKVAGCFIAATEPRLGESSGSQVLMLKQSAL